MRIVVTGADGFLGWHTRTRLRARTRHRVRSVGRVEWPALPQLLADADVVLHLAGVNRGTDREVLEGNIRLAEDVAAAVRGSRRPPVVIFANSVRAGEDTAYGAGKREAASILAGAAEEAGTRFCDVRLPNLFGEHGRPGYNSFVATFAAAVAGGRIPTVDDRDIELLHVQAAAEALIAAATDPTGAGRPQGTATSVGEVLDILRAQHGVYREGDMPTLASPLEVDLFNTLRAAMADHQPSIPLVRRTDPRGSLVELVRAHGGGGQTFFSTTRPGVTRGQHFHLRKVERFVVVSGTARISLRRMLTDEVRHIEVSGDVPVAVDMPTMWAHSLTNIGHADLTTIFWTNELFDPDDPDTYPEDV